MDPKERGRRGKESSGGVGGEEGDPDTGKSMCRGLDSVWVWGVQVILYGKCRV